MSNEKMENLLNLALDATEREREKSLDLDTGYDRAELGSYRKIRRHGRSVEGTVCRKISGGV